MRKFLFICALLCMVIYDVNAQDKDIVLEKQADSIQIAQEESENGENDSLCMVQASQTERPKVKQESSQVSKKVVSKGKQEKGNPQIQNEEKTSQKQMDGNATLIVLAVAIVCLFLKWRFSGRCRKCGKFRAMKEYDRDFLGTVKTKQEKSGDSYRTVYVRRYKIYRQCKYCGYKDSIFKDKDER